ncbi:MAG TPA: hypothetical protein VIU12_05550 [Chryseolinea sp.]
MIRNKNTDGKVRQSEIAYAGSTSDPENLEHEIAPVEGDIRKMIAERQALYVAEEISGRLRIKERGEVVADFKVFPGRGRFIFFGFLFRDVYSVGRILFAGRSRLDDKGSGAISNGAKISFFRLFRDLYRREANTVLIRVGVQLTIPPRQEDTQGKKKLDDKLFHQTVNLYKEAYTGKHLFFIWSMQTNAPHHFFL